MSCVSLYCACSSRQASYLWIGFVLRRLFAALLKGEFNVVLPGSTLSLLQMNASSRVPVRYADIHQVLFFCGSLPCNLLESFGLQISTHMWLNVHQLSQAGNPMLLSAPPSPSMQPPPLWYSAGSSPSLYSNLYLSNTARPLWSRRCLQAESHLTWSPSFRVFFFFLVRPFYSKILISAYPDPKLNINLFMRNCILRKSFHFHLILC